MVARPALKHGEALIVVYVVEGENKSFGSMEELTAWAQSDAEPISCITYFCQTESGREQFHPFDGQLLALRDDAVQVSVMAQGLDAVALLEQALAWYAEHPGTALVMESDPTASLDEPSDGVRTE